jgi:hypothetical protein
MACKRAARRKSSIWCFLVILMLHLRGVESSRSRVMTGRASGRDHGWPSGGSFFQVAKVGRDDTEMRWVGSGRRVADSWSECERRRRGKIAGEGDVEGEAERKRKDWLGRERNERNRKEAPPKRSGRNNKGLDGGDWKGFGAERCKGARETPRKDAERAIQEGSNGEDYTSQGTRTLSAWLGLGDAVGPLEQRYPRGSTWPLGYFRPND